MAQKKLGSVKRTDTLLTSAADLAADVSGVLPVANGGNGTGTFTNGQLLIGQTSGNTLAKAVLSGAATMDQTGAVSITGTGCSGALPGRLSLSSTLPVADVSAGTTLYYVPYLNGAISLYNGSTEQMYEMQNAISIAASGNFTAGNMYDVFCYQSSGTPTLEVLAWTNTTTRATAVTLQKGRWKKSGDATRLYLGSVYCTTTNQLDDDMTAATPIMGIWNVNNRVLRTGWVQDTTNSWSYTTGSYRAWNNSNANRVNVVQGLTVSESIIATMYGISNASAYPTGVGVDSTTANSAQERWPGSYGSSWTHMHKYAGRPGIGLRYIQALEYGGAAGVFYGDNNTPEYCRCGLLVEAWG